MRTSLLLALALLASSACSYRGEDGSADLDRVGAAGMCAPCEFLGNAGMCMNRNFEVARDALADEELGRAVEKTADRCPANEVCILCTDPRTGEDTGACQVAPLACPDNPEFVHSTCDKPIGYVQTSNLDQCGATAHCVSESLLITKESTQADIDLVASMAVCGLEGGRCVPDEIINTAGKFVFQTCTVTFGTAGRSNEGRCFPTTLPEVAENADTLKQGDCPDGYLCRACYSALDGDLTDACTMGCDIGPTTVATLLETCSGNGGRCLARNDIDEDDRDVLRRLDCRNGEVCVPIRQLDDSPAVNCTGDITRIGQYVGTCMDIDILEIDNEDRFEEQACEALLGNGFSCVPCRDEDNVLQERDGCDANTPLNSED